MNERLSHSRQNMGRLVRLSRASGFTLIELMVAMLLGLVVIAGVGSLFLSNQQVYRSNKALSDVQDSARIAFEMMARDVRAAGLSGCENSGRIANVVKGSNWWSDWTNAVKGYGSGQTDPVAGANRLANTDSLMLLGAHPSGLSVKNNAEPTGTFTLNESVTGLQMGDIILVCDPDHATLVQVSSVTGNTLTHDNSGTPGNCTKDLNYPTVCSSTSSYVFVPNSQVAKLNAAHWYVRKTANGSSLYRASLTTGAGGAATVIDSELVRDVTGLSMSYHQLGNAGFVTASNITDWSRVDALRATLTVASTDKRAGTDAKPVTRSFTTTTTIRNRVP
jgi:type IV pilus assembly protein PilW